MHRIYSTSYLTISADTSPNTASGSLHKRNMLGFTTCIHPSLVAQWNGPTPGYNYSKTLDKSNLTGKLVPQGARGICTGVVSSVIETGLLSERGWILQERLLSRKILH
jgi:hypothetical protein